MELMQVSSFIFLVKQVTMVRIMMEKKYDIHTQTTKSFHYLKDALSQANVTLDDVVKVNVYLTGMKYFEEMNAVYQTMFNEPFPARTCVAVYELPLGADVEIECIVKKPQSIE